MKFTVTESKKSAEEFSKEGVDWESPSLFWKITMLYL